MTRIESDSRGFLQREYREFLLTRACVHMCVCVCVCTYLVKIIVCFFKVCTWFYLPEEVIATLRHQSDNQV